jgi:integrase
MCSSAGISGKKTNHSLRLFGVSSMFEENIPEKIIQERSGHRSITALRVYEKITNQQMTTHQQMIEISRVLGPSSAPENPGQPIFHGCTFTNCTFSFQKPQ